MQCFGHFNMLTVHKYSDTRLFVHLSNPPPPPLLQSIISERNNLQDSSFFSKSCKFDANSGNLKKIAKIFFGLDIIAFELLT